jgi:hypothetical protein
MAYSFPRCEIVDGVWLAAADGRWRSLNSLVQKTRFRKEEIAGALRFLVKYGFAESSSAKLERFRMIMHGPSPFEAANLLRAVWIEAR